jgi:galactose oxidase-like protein
MPWEVLQTQTEIVAIHAALLATSPEGDVLCFGDWAGVTSTSAGPTLCRLYHMGSQTVEPFAPADAPCTNAFCGGQAFMAGGVLLVAGGTVRKPAPPDPPPPYPHDAAGHWDGERACWVYRQDVKRWFRVSDLNFQPGSTTKGGGRWYPIVVALGNGEVFAAGGHPSYTDDYVTPNGGPFLRHNNNTPERYSPATDTWTLITSDITAMNSVEVDAFPRFRLLPSGLLFTAGAGMGTKRIFDTVVGQWTGPDVDRSALPADYDRGSTVTSVLLPLLPPNYNPRVLAMSSPHTTTFLIDINATPTWQAAPTRQGSAAGKARDDACAVLLPTGQVLLSGGTIPGNPATPVFEPELYTPDVDWNTGAFTGPGSWATVNEPATVARPYHSVALLLPDGRVWTAGGTQPWSGLAQAEKRVELFSPWYVGSSRPRILSILRRRALERARKKGFDYGETFRVKVSGDIGRVALMRCGSVTHAYDSDQRYIGLVFSQQGDTLTVTAPPNGAIAPPGYYMLWIIDTTGVPCERAFFVHVPALRRVRKRLKHVRRPRRPKHHPPHPRR